MNCNVSKEYITGNVHYGSFMHKVPEILKLITTRRRAYNAIYPDRAHYDEVLFRLF